MSAAERDAAVAAAAAGDEPAFTALLTRHRREIHVHCYRMLGNFEEAEDLVQETFLRAWNNRASFGGVLNFRAWVYKIATNACLDAMRRETRRAPSVNRSFAEVPWIQPYPDLLLDEIAPRDDEPDAVLVARETIELAFLAVIQLLPARQRAVLVLRDVLDWPAADTADALEMSVAAVNSALQRARATLADHGRGKSPEPPSPYEQDLLAKFIDAHERGDAKASLAVVREDIRVTMPPHPWFYEGIDEIRQLMERAFEGGGMGEWKLVPTMANRMPTAASYLRRPGDTVFRAFKFDVLRIEGDRIAEITTFDSDLFAAFGLAETLPA
jgi:RNA polymerase sigma-70 factor (TIGR02960 family)